MEHRFCIGNRMIGSGAPSYVVAELSANHNQNFDQAVRILRAAKDAGADAVKLQTYTADTITLRSDKECFRITGGTLWDGRTLHDLYQEAFTPWEWQPKLKEIANELGMDLFSSAFDDSAVDFLEQMNVPAHKVASCELVDIGLIQKMARTGKPLMMSTGMASEEEIVEAVEAARGAGATQIALLKCTSAYPAPPEEANLLTIPELARRFGCPVGLSDHTMGIAVPVAAVALGACIIEKHLCLRRADGGPDGAFSLEPQEFKAMVEAVRTAEKALGYGAVRLRPARSRQPQVSALPVCRRRYKEGRVVHEAKRAFDSPSRRIAPKAPQRSSGKTRSLRRGAGNAARLGAGGAVRDVNSSAV